MDLGEQFQKAMRETANELWWRVNYKPSRQQRRWLASNKRKKREQHLESQRHKKGN